MLDKEYLPVPLKFEKWEDIPNYEGQYQISNLFRFRSLDKYVSFGKNSAYTRLKKGKLLSKGTNGKYPTIRMWDSNKEKSILLHRLIASIYLPNNDNKIEVNHINGNKSNFHPFNLEWATPSENQLHAYNYGLKKAYNRDGSSNSNAKLTNDKVIAIRTLFNSGLYKKSILSKMFNIDASCITDIINYKSWKSALA